MKTDTLGGTTQSLPLLIGPISECWSLIGPCHLDEIDSSGTIKGFFWHRTVAVAVALVFHSASSSLVTIMRNRGLLLCLVSDFFDTSYIVFRYILSRQRSKESFCHFNSFYVVFGRY